MSQETTTTAATLRPTVPAATLWLAAALFFGWLLVVRACWWEWSLNPQYEYGPLVPLLVALLLGRRWSDRPAPSAPSPLGAALSWAVIAGGALLLGLVQPLVISNADWRLVPALSGFCGVALTLSAIHLAGGRPWLRHFAFPVVFFLVAVPWPRPWENAIMSWLMNHNTGFCVEALQWFGYAAEQRGNLIAIPGALLGVEEACSGIRSLQSGIMVALAIGEFFRLGTAQRVFLLLLGLGAALAGNALRSLTLSVAACRAGTGAVDTIHDSTGLAVLAGASILVFIAGKLLAKANGRPSAGDAPHTSAISHQPFGIAKAKPLALSLVVLWVAALAGGEAWFRWHEARAPAAPDMWTLGPAGPDDDARPVPLAERTLDILLFPETAVSEQWRDDEGWQWQSFYFRWPPGPTSVQSAFVVHDPRVCLGAAGFELEKPLAPWTAVVGGFRIPFQRFLFRDRGRPLHVFHAVVEDDGSAVATGESFTRGSRWADLRAGRRNRGLRVLELAVRGPLDAAEAEASAQAWLSRRIVPDRP